MNKCIIVTGGSGFIGSAVIRLLLAETDFAVVNIDKLTYAVNPMALHSVQANNRYIFCQLDICQTDELHKIFAQYQPCFVINLAAESHVDRSISGAAPFIQTNIVGTFSLLQAGLQYWRALNLEEQSSFRFLHVSTDEVFGDIPSSAAAATELSRYEPSSPYSASKAASDHLVFAWWRTYKLPVLITHCTNNYGPYQHTEKFIPLIINRALNGLPIPIYGDGLQIRDWLYVDDHVRALIAVLQSGEIGQRYNISANNQLTNLQVVHTICSILNQTATKNVIAAFDYHTLIEFVEDRPGHDRRYALNAEKIQQLSWRAVTDFPKGIEKTIDFYLKQSCQNSSS